MNNNFIICNFILNESSSIKDFFKNLGSGIAISAKTQAFLAYNIPKIILKNLKSTEKSPKKTLNEISKLLDKAAKDIKNKTDTKTKNIVDIVTTITLLGFISGIFFAINAAYVRMAMNKWTEKALRDDTLEDTPGRDTILYINKILVYSMNVLIAPALEELSRNIYARQGKSFLYGHILNILELWQAFGTNRRLIGGSSMSVIKGRIAPTAGHYVFSAVQDKLTKQGHPNLGFLCAFILHASGNFVQVTRAFKDGGIVVA